jgi:hypothetical protein
MRRVLLYAAAACGVLLFSIDAGAQTRRSQIEGFGGMTFGNNATSASTFGGSIALPLTDNIRIIGEAGRLSDLKSSFLDLVTDFTPVDVRLSAWPAKAASASSRRRDRRSGRAEAGRFGALTAGVHGAGTFGGIANTALGFSAAPSRFSAQGPA